MPLPIAVLTRKIIFSAAHRLHNSELTDEENIQYYGICNHGNCHGHNYTVEVSVRGPIDARTGMVINFWELKDALELVITKNLDHKNLDKDVAFFKNNPSTTENVAIYIWNNMQSVLKSPELLYQVKVSETEKNSVYYRGQSTQHLTNARCNGQTGMNITSDSD